MTNAASWHLRSNMHRTTVNGCDVRYMRAGSGTPVVFVHTLRTQLDMFLRVIEQLHSTQAEVALSGDGRHFVREDAGDRVPDAFKAFRGEAG